MYSQDKFQKEFSRETFDMSADPVLASKSMKSSISEIVDDSLENTLVEPSGKNDIIFKE